jgi:hypothetical protein
MAEDSQVENVLQIVLPQPVYFVSGHDDLSEEEFDEYYAPRLDRLMQKDLYFIVGDSNGADAMAQGYFAARGYQKVMIYHAGDAPKINVGNFGCVGGFKGDKTKNIAMTMDSFDDVVYVRKVEEQKRRQGYEFGNNHYCLPMVNVMHRLGIHPMPRSAESAIEELFDLIYPPSMEANSLDHTLFGQLVERLVRVEEELKDCRDVSRAAVLSTEWSILLILLEKRRPPDHLHPVMPSIWRGFRSYPHDRECLVCNRLPGGTMIDDISILELTANEPHCRHTEIHKGCWYILPRYGDCCVCSKPINGRDNGFVRYGSKFFPTHPDCISWAIQMGCKCPQCKVPVADCTCDNYSVRSP